MVILRRKKRRRLFVGFICKYWKLLHCTSKLLNPEPAFLNVAFICRKVLTICWIKSEIEDEFDGDRYSWWLSLKPLDFQFWTPLIAFYCKQSLNLESITSSITLSTNKLPAFYVSINFISNSPPTIRQFRFTLTSRKWN